jgi:hypothetical protein
MQIQPNRSLTAPLPEAAQRNVGDNQTPVRTSPMMKIMVDRFVGDRRGPRQVQLALGVSPDIAIKYNAGRLLHGHSEATDEHRDLADPFAVPVFDQGCELLHTLIVAQKHPFDGALRFCIGLYRLM